MKVKKLVKLLKQMNPNAELEYIFTSDVTFKIDGLNSFDEHIVLLE